jgi:thioesterase domain-containing protein
MTITDFIEELRQKEIEVFFSGGKLKYSGPEEFITPELIGNLTKFKGKLMKHFWPKEYTNMMPINTEGNKIPLFLVHSDHGNYTISDYFGIDQPVYGFFHPGSNGEKIIYKSISEMAKVYLNQILSLRPTGPYYLSGFSFGGVLAYEMAIQLQRSNHKVPFLVLIDSVSPLAREPIRWNGNTLKLVKKNILSPIKSEIEKHLKFLICNVYFLFNQSVPIKWRQFYRWEKYGMLAKKYRPEKFKGRILLFKTSENTSSFEYLGWETLVDEIKAVNLSAGHLTIFKNKISVDILQTELERHLKYVSEFDNE